MKKNKNLKIEKWKKNVSTVNFGNRNTKKLMFHMQQESGKRWNSQARFSSMWDLLCLILKQNKHSTSWRTKNNESFCTQNTKKKLKSVQKKSKFVPLQEESGKRCNSQARFKNRGFYSACFLNKNIHSTISETKKTNHFSHNKKKAEKQTKETKPWGAFKIFFSHKRHKWVFGQILDKKTNKKNEHRIFQNFSKKKFWNNFWRLL